MAERDDKTTITPKELSLYLGGENKTTLLDVLPSDHYNRVRIPGAKNVCVFSVSFLNDLAELVPDKTERIVIYGSSNRSHDTRVAVEKMKRAGYQNIYALEGGLEGWRESDYGLEGDSIDLSDDPQTTLSLPDGNYVIDRMLSRIEWAGRNPTTRHIGTVEITEGVVKSRSGIISGAIEVDMNTIRNISLEGDEMQPVLEAHLRSDDFFFTSMFPKAVLHFSDIAPIEPGWQSTPNYHIKGELTLRGVSAPLDFHATVNLTDNMTMRLEAHFDLDRTRWNVIYGSSRFFEHLGMHKVFDLISLQVNVLAVC